MHYALAMTAAEATYDEIEDAILHLPVSERSRLAARILESIEDDEDGISPEWRDEIERRARDIDEGRTVSVPAKEVWKQVNDRFGIEL